MWVALFQSFVSLFCDLKILPIPAKSTSFCPICALQSCFVLSSSITLWPVPPGICQEREAELAEKRRAKDAQSGWENLCQISQLLRETR